MADILPSPTASRLLAALLPLLFLGAVQRCVAQDQSDPKALAVVRGAVASQLEADRNDRTNWIYIDHDVTPDQNAIYECVGSPQGELRRQTKRNGADLDASDAQAESKRIEDYVNDPSAQARAHKNGAHDEAQAVELLQMLPDAFIWTIASDSPEAITLNFRPNPKFDGPDMQSRVMSLMAGQLVVTHKGNIIRTLRGTLTEEFKIAYGLIGHLNKGGTFDVERRDVGGGHWEITETHVHIGGHALFFKSIGTQQDEVKTEWRPSPAQSLHEAARILGAER